MRHLLASLVVLAPTLALAQSLEVTAVDVGQGDAIAIIAPSGCAALIDGGPTGEGATVKTYLRSRGVSSLDFAIASHYHADHIGGLDEVDQGTDALPISLVYDRGGSYSTTTYSEYATRFSGRRSTVTLGQTFSLCGEVSFEVVAVNANGVSTTDENARSVAVKLSYAGFDMLLGGDLSGYSPDIESLAAPRAGDVEAYKVHHHGSSTSSNETLLAALTPAAAIISLGWDNTYGHPHSEALARLDAVGAEVWMTEDPAARKALGSIAVRYQAGAPTFTVTQASASASYAVQGAAADTTPPTAPTQLAAAGVSTSEIELGWTASTDDVGVAEYRVYRSLGGTLFDLAGTTTTTAFTDAGLASASTYTYFVTALDAAQNESDASASVSATTLGGDTAAPTAPTNPSATALTATTVRLAWTASVDDVGVAGYRVLRDGAVAGTTAATTYDDAGLSAGVTYDYAIDAYDAAGNTSPPSATVSITMPAAQGAVFINEVLANELRSYTDREFVEIRNSGATSVDLGGWTLADATGVRHTFASGTVLAAGKVVAVFASASGIPKGLTNAVAATTGALGLSNDGDTVTLRSAAGAVVDSITYGTALAGTDGVSMNRSPDGVAGATLVLHTKLSKLKASPGVRVDGSAW